MLGLALLAPAAAPSFAGPTEGRQDDKATPKIELKGLW
jgi:hypothetical protein